MACQGNRLVELVSMVRHAALDAGRDADRIEITVDAPRNEADAEIQMRLGVNRVVVNAPNVATDDIAALLEQRMVGVQQWFGNI